VGGSDKSREEPSSMGTPAPPSLDTACGGGPRTPRTSRAPLANRKPDYLRIGSGARELISVPGTVNLANARRAWPISAKPTDVRPIVSICARGVEDGAEKSGNRTHGPHSHSTRRRAGIKDRRRGAARRESPSDRQKARGNRFGINRDPVPVRASRADFHAVDSHPV
jgi:hypothetical protein